MRTSRASLWTALAVLLVAPAAAASGAVPSLEAWQPAVAAWCGRAPGVPDANGASFEVLGVMRDRGVTHVLIGRRWQGFRVVPERVRLSFSGDGRLLLAAGSFSPLPSELAATRIDALAACGSAARSGRGEPLGGDAEAVVHADRAGARRAWRVPCAEGGTGAAAVIVDATTGEAIDSESPPVHAACLAYDPDPRSPLAEHDLPWLAGDGSWLRTPWMIVEGAQQERLFRPDGDFRVVPTTPDTTMFDHGNAAWQVGRYLHGFLAHLGYPGPPDTIVVRVKLDLSPYVAVTTGRFVLIGNPVAGFTGDAGKAADLMLHEAQHAVTNGFGIEGAGEHREANALHEGLSDYMAAAATGDPAIGEWLYLPYPSGATRVDMPASEFRFENYDFVRFGSASVGTSWANSMIISGALWDLRGTIGESADSLVLEALPFLSPRPMFAEFANALIVADRTFHAGRFVDAIRAAMTGRGIRSALAIVLDGPLLLAPGQAGTFRVRPTGLASGAAAWFTRSVDAAGVPGEWVSAGSGDSISAGSDGDFDVRVTLAGIWGDTASAVQSVSVTPPLSWIEAPPVLPAGRPARLHAGTRGVAPFTYSWFVQVGGNWLPAGSNADLQLTPTSTMRLRVAVRDQLGRTSGAEARIRTVRATLTAPSRALPGAPVEASVSVDTLVVGLRVAWWLRRWCNGAPCAAPAESIGAADTTSFAIAEDARLTAVLTLPWGTSFAESTLVIRNAPTIAVQGPVAVGAAISYSATTTTVAASWFDWFLRPGSPSAQPQYIGTGPTILVSTAPPWGLTARVTDMYGRAADTTVVFLGKVVDAESGAAFALAVSRAADGFELRLSAPRAGPARVDVLDVAGRRVASPWSGVLDGQGRSVRWAADGAASGLYFVRLAWGDRTMVRRIALVR